MELPLILHVREAHSDALQILKDYQRVFPHNNVGIVHCFIGGMTEAAEYISLGYYLGIGGAVTKRENKDLREAVRQIPLSAIVLETDAPYVMPEGIEERRNSSLNLPIIAEEVARIKGISVKEVIRITTLNAKKLFRL